MRITYPTRRTAPVITLGRSERPMWDMSADGRDQYDTRQTVMKRVRSLFAAGAEQVEVYAPAEAGGYMINQHTA
jgi:hypothetical protein